MTALIKVDGRHANWAHPLGVMVFLFTAVIGTTIAAHDYLVTHSSLYGPSSGLELGAPNLNFSPTLAYGFIIYVVLMVLCRYADCGSYIFYETAWCCNSSLIMAGIGILTHRPLLVGASIAGVCCDQLLWYIDCVGYALTGKFKIGVAKYLAWPETSWSKRYLCAHHLWFMPAALWALGWHLPAHSFLLSCLFTSVSTGLSRYVTPKTWKDVFGGHEHYMNVNAGHEFWKDAAKGTFFHSFNDSPGYIYLPFMMLVANCLLNGPPFLLISAVMATMHK